MEHKITRFKLWLMENGVKQNALSKNSLLSIGTLHRCINYGDATDKTIKLISLSLNEKFDLSITESEIKTMLNYKI